MFANGKLNFQSSLSSLTTREIQQFLDELTFRELFGNYPLLAFDSMIERLAIQTVAVLENNSTMVARCRRVSDNPFNDWRINKLPEPVRNDYNSNQKY